jgi:hypothetical protein
MTVEQNIVINLGISEYRSEAIKLIIKLFKIIYIISLYHGKAIEY